MISRRYLRTKVMQAIFAHEMNPAEDIVEGEKKLTRSIESCYTLFLFFFSLLPELKHYRERKMEDVKEKFNPTFQDLNPNTKFVDNMVIRQIEEHPKLQILWKEHKIYWTDQTELIAKLYKEISELSEFEAYMNSQERTYAEDKKLVLTIIEKVLAPNEILHWFFEEQNLHWFDDYNDALLSLYKNIAAFKETSSNVNKIYPLFKDKEEDITFYKELYLKTIMHCNEYEKIIENKLHNWELERVMGVDMILLKMGICEFLEFQTIPIKVTINEYIELAKNYSSAKSGLFINGLLDNMVADFKAENKLQKIGRGLLNA